MPAASIVLAALLLPASEEDELRREVETYLDEVQAVATRTPLRAFDAPFSAQTVSAKTIAERSYRSLPQSLAQVSGVLVQETSAAQGSPFIRGFTGYLTVYLVDGVRLNNSVFRAGPNQYSATVDPFSLARLEVVKGPSSVLYGSDAVGGTVLAVTEGPYTWGEGWKWGGRATYRGATAERSHQARLEASVTRDEVDGVFGGVSAKAFGDVEAGGDVGRQPDTGYDEWDGDLKYERRTDANTRLVAAYQHVRQNDAPRTHRLVTAKPFHGTTVGNELRHHFDQERWLAYVQWHKEKIGGWVDALRLNASWHAQSEVRDRLRPPSSPGGQNRRDVEGFDVGTLGLWAQLESDSPAGRLTYGIDYYRDEVDSFSTANAIQGPVGDDASYDLLGLFVQDAIDIGERWRLLAGARFTWAAAEADRVRDPATGGQISIEDDWSALVGSVRALYRLVPDRWNLFGGVSQGFRAPNLSDLTRFDVARTNEVEVAAPGLDPERYTSFEAGAKGVLGRSWTELAVYLTLIRDQILPFPTGAVDASGNVVVSKANVGDGYVWGVEWSGGWAFHPNWTAFGIANFQYGEVSNFTGASQTEIEDYVSRLLPLSAQIGLRWEDEGRRIWVEGLVLMADKADRLSAGDGRDTQRIPPGGTPGYAVVHLRAGARIGERLSLVAGIENLLDKAYRVHGSGTTMPGLNFVLSVTGTF
jgi:hemoglobin/transferrin/lactoferrin receptor protein